MIRTLDETFKTQFNMLIKHPLQSWEWGEFRRNTGIQVSRFGQFKDDQLISAFQLSLHKIPYLPLNIGYIPKSKLPNEEMIDFLTQFGKNHNCIFIKLEPDAIAEDTKILRYEDTKRKLETNSQYLNILISQYPALKISKNPMFTKYTFYIDLTKSEEELMNSFSQKTRYNIRVAQKHGVTIQEENTAEAFNRYLQLTKETTARQKFYAHDENYHQLMWQHFSHQPTTYNLQLTTHLLTARYQGKILVTWVLFLFNNILYYPYGASSHEYKNVMASTLMMWEAIRWGKNHGAKTFDLWGTPGPDPAPSDPYFGFHRFKLGFGPRLVEFIGSYDLVISPMLYTLFNFINSLRWLILKSN